MKQLLFIGVLFFLAFFCRAQNKQILYNFDKTPTALLLNPGSEVDYKYHIGVPILSNISTHIGSSGFTLADMFRNDNVDFTTKVNNILNKVSNNDYLHLHTQTDIINIGFKHREKNYFSFGFYTEIDAFIYLPKDILKLLNEGNSTFLNKRFNFSQLRFNAEVLGVLHAGFTRNINEKLILGGRLKLYSGALNVTTSGNKGNFTTIQDPNGTLIHQLNNVQLQGYTSGFVNTDDDIIVEPNQVIKNVFLGGNYGLGLDFGFTYKLSKQLKLTASLLDIGFINYTKKNKNGTVNGDYSFSGIDFLFDPDNPVDYLDELNQDFNDNILREENTNSYTVYKSIKFNSSLEYSWGRSRTLKSCYDIGYKEYFNNTIGAQLYTNYRLGTPIIAFTGSYQRRISENLTTKLTYTIDDYTYSNIGFGVSTRIANMINIYASLDNLLEFSDIANSNSASLQFGINLIFK